MSKVEPGTSSFYVYIVVIVGLVLFAGMMSGLTLGLMSLGLVDLEVLVKSGQPSDRKHAAKILPVVKNQHLLLCTLLIGNALAMEALPIFLDAIVNTWGAILISVTLILAFGEIAPQAICSRFGLAVGAAMAPVVRVLLVIFFPVAFPISKLLDLILGKGHDPLFRRAELKTLVDMHGNAAGKGGELTNDETTIIAGALELTEKTASQAMTPIKDVFALDVNAKLDLAMMQMIMEKGHSRIPVYAGSVTYIVGLILVKNLLTFHPQDETPVRNCTIRKIPRVPEGAPLYDILNDFQKGHSHMAVVVKYNKEKADSLKQNREQSKLDRRLGSQKHPRRNFDSNSSKVIKSDEGSAAGHFLSQRTKKWEQTGTRNVLEIGDETLTSFPNDEEVIGIITMEDLIEELLQEEILDETDEYVNIHNKIRVNPVGKPLLAVSQPMPTVQGIGSELKSFQIITDS
ncbi:unnamed protein product [Sphagnum jensenii]|uniref:CNNM transmembrane domain-containing protein n=1 Tax=Sphagnum jensenii TaxID=128206 RepID=A0ABP0XDT2_9BRYO